jgi:hypothetical protein
MTRKKDRTFDVDQVDRIVLSDGPREVDIGFLSNDTHTNAFVAIFRKMINDNREIFAESHLIGIESKQFVKIDIERFRSFYRYPELTNELALVLYESDNDYVTLLFKKLEQRIEVFVGFDNPYFRMKQSNQAL